MSSDENSDDDPKAIKLDILIKSRESLFPKRKSTSRISQPIDEIVRDSEEGPTRTRTEIDSLLPNNTNSDINELLDQYCGNQMQRYSGLTRPGKSISYPAIWRSVHNQDKNQHPIEEEYFIVLSLKPESKEVQSMSSASPLEKNDQNMVLANASNSSHSSKVAEWRHGPGKFWYDMYNAPENKEGFDYGFKLKRKIEEEEGEPHVKSKKFKNEVYDEESFLLVNQVSWESDVIWDGEVAKDKVLEKLKDKNVSSAWLPSFQFATLSQFSQELTSSSDSMSTNLIESHWKPSLPMKSAYSVTGGTTTIHVNRKPESTWSSILPTENDELLYSVWEDNVIWDAENMDKIPEPKLLTLDLNDDNILIHEPDDFEPNLAIKQKPKGKEKKGRFRDSRVLPGKEGGLPKQDSIVTSSSSDEKDPYNISNDEYYQPKMVPKAALKPAVDDNLLHHSIPALELHQSFFPINLSRKRLQEYPQQPLKRFCHGKIANTKPHGVHSLEQHIDRMARVREQKRIKSGGGEMFFMRTPEDLTGKDGDLVLMEYSEEQPPLIMQVGMASKIKNYYRKKSDAESGEFTYKYGEELCTPNTPFLGNLACGQSLQVLVNNLFRAPIYEHRFPETDFLIIRTRDNYFVRSIETIFTVGQELPIYQVPSPFSMDWFDFKRKFIQLIIYRLFLSSPNDPKQIKIEDLKKALPLQTAQSLRNCLKKCARFQRSGTNKIDANSWLLKSNFRIPPEDEIRALISPEAYCASYSMLAAEQRLKDAGHGKHSMFTPDEADYEHSEMDDEVKAAPWNTTRAFISAMKQKGMLQLKATQDPTGCGTGITYVSLSYTKSMEEQRKRKKLSKKFVTGTEADLRKLRVKEAKDLLRKFGVPEKEINKLTRWELIDVVREMSTKQARKLDRETVSNDSISKFARCNQFSLVDYYERYKEECQNIFDFQNRLLASVDESSTDKDESEEEDLNLSEIGKKIESMLANKKTTTQFNTEEEEKERLKLKKLMLGEGTSRDNAPKRKESDQSTAAQDATQASGIGSSQKRLKISRTFKNAEGEDVTRIEIVHNPAVIATYLRIRSTKNKEFIKKLVMTDQEKIEERLERRRILDRKRKKKLKLKNSDKHMKCGACEGYRHRSNSRCPLITINKGMNEKTDANLLDDDQSVGKSISFKIKIPKDLWLGVKRKRMKTAPDTMNRLQKLDYNPVQRPRIDQSKTMSDTLNEENTSGTLESETFDLAKELEVSGSENDADFENENKHSSEKDNKRRAAKVTNDKQQIETGDVEEDKGNWTSYKSLLVQPRMMINEDLDVNNDPFDFLSTAFPNQPRTSVALESESFDYTKDLEISDSDDDSNKEEKCEPGNYTIKPGEQFGDDLWD